jgi:Tfp pilus assembly protein PilN
MIQFNLLPDVKRDYIKAQRTKRMVIGISVLVTAAALALLVLLSMTVFVFQKQHMNHLSTDIAKYGKDLQSTSDLNKILTVQGQLRELPSLHEQKPEVNRLIPFVKQLTPAAASISSLNIDFAAHTMTITGSADSLQTVNQFVDTLKFTTYNQAGATPKAFSSVVLSTFGRADKGASYTINLGFAQDIFDNTKSVDLTVPNIITTRSEIDKPGVLFEPVTNSNTKATN